MRFPAVNTTVSASFCLRPYPCPMPVNDCFLHDRFLSFFAWQSDNPSARLPGPTYADMPYLQTSHTGKMIPAAVRKRLLPPGFVNDDVADQSFLIRICVMRHCVRSKQIPALYSGMLDRILRFCIFTYVHRKKITAKAVTHQNSLRILRV